MSAVSERSAALRVRLPRPAGHIEEHVLSGREVPPGARVRGRVAFAAAHVVADPFAAADPADATAIDWERTLAFRHHLWSLGFGIAEAMDTAQRGMGLAWPQARELIERSAREAASVNGRLACGAGTDQLDRLRTWSLPEIGEAYAEQIAFIEACGAQPVMLASHGLAAAAQEPDDYRAVYSRVLSGVSVPVILHWLGDMFDPGLSGYWGSDSLDEATEVVLDVIGSHADRVDGIKVSLLDAAREVELRRRLPEGVRLYTGDDFNYDVLIRGDAEGHSDAMLGIFDPIAPVAAAALEALAEGAGDRYDELMSATVPLARRMFQAPTQRYKTGVVFLAWLNGHQSHFRMLAGMESARSLVHLADLLVLADEARVLSDPELAAERARRLFSVAGVE
jgi:hypothetical protein